jgi:hypothetical protein
MRVGLILSGSNIDTDKLATVFTGGVRQPRASQNIQVKWPRTALVLLLAPSCPK